MTAPLPCPVCYSIIPADAPGGMCPRCLLSEGMGAELPEGPALAETVGGSAAGSTTDASPLPAHLRYLGDYELLAEIARGGMGVVYRAKQTSLNRVVAVKMILAGHLADESAVLRFRQEANAAAALDHPHIVPIYEVGEHNGRQFFSMGYVPGTSLADRLLGGPLPAEEAARLVLTIAEAVQYAHQQGVIHRDLKPANILLDEAGRPRVTDFGLAKMATREQSLTNTGQALGTPGYMPPEQVQGGEIGPTADVYALGAILYALLTGRPPFQAATPLDTMLQVIAAEPASPRQLNPSVPRDLETIALKCLEKRTEWRYASAQDLADELRRFLDGQPIHARRPGWVEQGGRWLARQKRSVALAVGVAGATAALLIGSVFGTAIYRKSLEGKLSLDTEHARLIAEIRSPAGEAVVPAFTVPTQQPVVLPAGEYTLRTSGKQLLSEDVSIRVERGQTQNLSLSLDKQLLWPTIEIAGTVHVVRYAEGRAAGILDLHEKGMRFSDVSLKQDLWTRSFEPLEDEKFKAVPGFRWSWFHWDTQSSGFGQYDYRPQVVEPCPRLDADALGDIVLVCRHQPVVIAISTNKGEVLWAYAPQGMAEVAKALETRISSGPALRTGTIVGKPLVVPDLDGDGTVDLIVAATLVSGDRSQDLPQPMRVIDAVSGKTGKRLWRFPLADDWFKLFADPLAPRAATWFARQRGSSGGGSTLSPYGNTFRDFQTNKIVGDAVLLPFPPQLLRYKGESVVSCVAGNWLVLLDPRTGQEVTPAQGLQFFPIAPPRVAQGKGKDSLVLVQNISVGGGLQKGHEGTGLTHWSPAKAAPLWSQAVLYANYEKDSRSYQPRPQWPVVVDLNGDGQAEMISPHGSSLDQPVGFFPSPNSRAWGEIVMFSHTDGGPVWTRRLETVDQQVDQFIAGPDIDGDGWRDLFAANIFDRGQNPGLVYVDALSGRTGEILWSAGQPLTTSRRSQVDQEIIGDLSWWNVSARGASLIVPVLNGASGGSQRLFIFNAADGRLLKETGDLIPMQITDGDGDGLDDLFCFVPTNSQSVDKGGKLLSFRGTGEAAWHRLGGAWQAGSDYDGDGAEDVVSAAVEYVNGEQVLTTRSGRDGNLLARAPASTSIWSGAQVRPLGADLNGDGVHDFASVDVRRGSVGGGTPPLHVFSGKTCRELWEPSFGAPTLGATLSLEARDLEGDGEQELIYVAELGISILGAPAPHSAEPPLWLVVLEGGTGKLRWLNMLHDRNGVGSGSPRALPLAYADLDGDKIADIIAPAVNFKNQYPELRAYNGKTGELLWNPVPLPGDGGHNGQFVVDYLPRPTVADLDGDGQPEILVQDFFRPHELAARDLNATTRTEPVATGTPEQQQAARLLTSRVQVLDGRTGREKWHWDCPTGSESSQHNDGGGMADYRSRPLIVRRGTNERPAICVWLWAGNWEKPEATLLLLDVEGQEIWRLPVKLQVGNRFFRVWNHDLTGDGRDELIFVDGTSVQAWEPQAKQPVWQFTLASWMATILSIEPAAGDLPAQVVVASGRRVQGLAGPTGKPLWSCAGLPEVHLPTVPLKEQLLRDTSGSRLPRILYAGGDAETTCLQATYLGQGKTQSIERVPVAIRPLTRDPRFARPLPWSSPDGHAFYPFGRPLLVLSGLAYCLVLVILPAYLLLQMAWHRRWSLGFFLLLPVAVGLMLLALQLPLPERRPYESLAGAKIGIIIIVLPALSGLLLVGYWLWRGHWKWPVATVVLFVIWTIVLAGIWLMIDQKQASPIEFYDWQRWWILLLMTGYSISAFVTLVWLVRSLVRWVAGFFWRSKSRPGVAA